MLSSCTAGVLPPDDKLVSFPFGFERKAARRLVKTGRLRAVKVGRRWYAKQSEILALVDDAPPPVAPARASGADLRGDLAVIADRVRTGGK